MSDKFKSKCIMRFSLLCFLLFLCVSSKGYTATYYIDYSAGFDSSDGLSTSTPWKHCPGDDNATDTARSTILTGGDIAIFKGGVQYDGRIDLDDDGISAGSRITYDGNSTGSWGIGRAIIDGGDSYTRGFTGSSVYYVTIKNFEIRDILHSGNDSRAIKINTVSYVTIQDCYVHDVGNYSPSAVVQGTGIWLLNGDNALVTGNDITEVGYSGVFFSNMIDSTISENTIHDYVNWGIGAVGTSADILITGNTIYDIFRFDNGYWLAGGGPPHSNGIFLYEESGNFPKRFTIEKNLFYNNETFDEHGGSYMINTSNGNEGLIIRNNVFINAHSYFVIGLRESSQTDNCEIYNNTIYSPRTTGIQIGSAENGYFTIKNNVIVSNQTAMYAGSSADYENADWDYNYYTVESGTESHKEGAATRPLAYVQSNWNGGIETNSTAGFDKSAILFVDESGYPTSCETMDLSLQSSSPLLGVGTTIGSFSDDYNDTTRPIGTPWDIGAYQFGLESPKDFQLLINH